MRIQIEKSTKFANLPMFVFINCLNQLQILMHRKEEVDCVLVKARFRVWNSDWSFRLKDAASSENLFEDPARYHNLLWCVLESDRGIEKCSKKGSEAANPLEPADSM